MKQTTKDYMLKHIYLKEIFFNFALFIYSGKEDLLI